MLRTLCVAVVAATCLSFASATLAEAGQVDARITVGPHQGAYAGTDEQRRPVHLSFADAHMFRLRVSGTDYGSTPVTNGAWAETCHHGFCTRGHWDTRNHVTGDFRREGGDWSSFQASYAGPVVPHTGTYAGHDHDGREISFFRHGPEHLGHVTVAEHQYGAIPASGATFAGCIEDHGQPRFCFRGHWQSPYDVVGTWSTSAQPSPVHWRAHVAGFGP